MNDEPVEILGLATAAPGGVSSESSPTCGDASRGLTGPGAPSPAGAPFQGTELGLFQDVPWWACRQPICVPDIATVLE